MCNTYIVTRRILWDHATVSKYTDMRSHVIFLNVILILMILLFSKQFIKTHLKSLELRLQMHI